MWNFKYNRALGRNYLKRSEFLIAFEFHIIPTVFFNGRSLFVRFIVLQIHLTDIFIYRTSYMTKLWLNVFCLVWILPCRLAFYVAFIAITFTYCQFALCTRRACTGFSLLLPYILNEQSLCAISSERPRIHTSRLDWPFIHIAQPFYFLYLIRALTTNCSWMLIVAIIKALTCRFRDCVRRMCRLWRLFTIRFCHCGTI